MQSPQHYTIAQVADILGVSKETLRRWDRNGTLVPERQCDNNYRLYAKEQLVRFEEAQLLFNSNWLEEYDTKPIRPYRLLELFAGAGGLAVGMELAGFQSVLLNEIDPAACKTLRKNRPEWNVVEGDIANIDFTPFHGQIDILSGGFPCQAFSYAGKKLGFEDTRGTLFFEFARAVNETQPKVFVAENVRGLLAHENGSTLETIKNIIDELGYFLVPPRILKAIFYKVPQKRERLFLIGIKKDLADKVSFRWPSPYYRIMTVKDALKAGDLYPTDAPESFGQKYPQRKEEILAQVPPGGYWKDLPDNLQREYMQKSYFLGGGKTGMARRLSWDEPSLTLTCAPAQKQTERCHPEETRPLTVREYARIQTFPDSWRFEGALTAQYKQIGNAVPVNLAYAVGRSLVRLLNEIEETSHLGL
ncbi:DNA (cytosine-5-)-methyltransferase [Testudinibacter sp. TR-2022]|nr:DNA (cytosine-5-)-methyltransferase [Pasteurellaceae bacterium Phil31]TNH07234.1 DNA (cytosine-5-)-methyltransferase [Testudinibacter sp. TR-2022]TNH12089.1 DNA (cytosine-5-)-methyltransferase [Testudinibacter sp. TR-2022]TNH15537.1 DNA (cytosine-5-)-methyltransferase [Testudinibacter sp. TR-2022]TNH15728.1 DNA (cytosine-5-)-methyltransferase [Testudinibacter sp. TR-2022]